MTTTTKNITVLSLFDGMGCAYLALKKLGYQVNYFASEIDPYAVKVTSTKIPGITHLGDVTNWKSWTLPKIDLLIGGSPCQGFSFAGDQLNFHDQRSKLFFHFADIKNHLQSINPNTTFLLENVKMKKEYECVISYHLGVHPITINSALLSAQNRIRLYWSNIQTQPFNLFNELVSTIPLPEDKNIVLQDVLQPSHSIPQEFFLDDQTTKKLLPKNYSPTFNHQKTTVRSVKQINPSTESRNTQPFQHNRVYDSTGLSPALCSGFSNGPIITNHSHDQTSLRRLTPIECCRLQTVPDDWFFHDNLPIVPNTQIYKMLGNGFTVDVIAHILQYLSP